MNILAIDSCSSVASCALLAEDKLLAESYLNHDKTHSQKLLPMIELLLQDAEFDINNIDLFACTIGPGSFTGQRIGIATIKGLAQATGKPCAGVSALEAMAYNIPFTDYILSPIMDARRNQVYNGIYKWEGNDLITLEKDRALPFDELLNELKGKKVIFLGDGTLPFKNRLLDFKIAPPHISQIRASSVAILAKKMPAVSYHELMPLYLRKSQAEREYEMKQKKREEMQNGKKGQA